MPTEPTDHVVQTTAGQPDTRADPRVIVVPVDEASAARFPHGPRWISAVQLTTYPPLHRAVFLECQDRYGELLRGHLMIPVETMDQVARDWLAFRQEDVPKTVAEQVRDAAEVAIRGFRRWKRNLRRGGSRHEADHGLTDLGQGLWDLAEALGLNEQENDRP